MDNEINAMMAEIRAAKAAWKHGLLMPRLSERALSLLTEFREYSLLADEDLAFHDAVSLAAT